MIDASETLISFDSRYDLACLSKHNTRTVEMFEHLSYDLADERLEKSFHVNSYWKESKTYHESLYVIIGSLF